MHCRTFDSGCTPEIARFPHASFNLRQLTWKEQITRTHVLEAMIRWFACSCIVDKKPQRMDTDRANILCNIAELVTREIEADWAAQQQKLQCITLLRTMESYKQAFMFVDVAAPGWRVLFINDHAIERTGTPPVTCITLKGATAPKKLSLL